MTEKKTPQQKSSQPQKKICPSDLAKVPPQAIDLEEAVLGALILEGQEYKNVAHILKTEYFYKQSHQYIFQAIEELAFNNEPIDILLVTEKLRKIKKLNLIDEGPVYIAKLTSKVASANHVVFHARIIKQTWIQREVIRICHKYSKASYDEKFEVDELIVRLTNEISELGNSFDEGNRKISSKEVISKLKERSEDEEQAQKVKWLLGWKKFDEIVGIRKNKIVLLGGPAKAGKTKFNLAAMFTLLEKYDDVSVYWVSLEDSADDVFWGFVSRKILIPSESLKEGRYSKQDYDHIIDQCAKIFEKFDIEFVENSTRMTDIRRNFKSFCKLRKNKLNILIIDNILSLDDRYDFKGNDNSMYDFVMAEILKTKQETQGLIIPIHHFNDAQQDPKRIENAYRPLLKHLKGTEGMRRTPNQILLINNPSKYKDLVAEYGERSKLLEYLFICDVAANRHGKSDDEHALIRFLCTLDYNIFEEL